jgi:aryl-alcohol dehydrogenase-like predicted oxidoreductase
VVGRALRDFAKRDVYVLATKVFNAMGPGPNDKGLSRKRILSAETDRAKTDEFGKKLYGADGDFEIVNKVSDIAWNRGIPNAQVALAWMLGKPVVTAPIIGASKPGHLEDAVGALSVKLSDEEVHELEALYQPHPVLGFS